MQLSPKFETCFNQQSSLKYSFTIFVKTRSQSSMILTVFQNLLQKTCLAQGIYDFFRFLLPMVLLCISHCPTNLLHRLWDTHIFAVHILHGLVIWLKNTTHILSAPYIFSFHGIFNFYNPFLCTDTNASFHLTWCTCRSQSTCLIFASSFVRTK